MAYPRKRTTEPQVTGNFIVMSSGGPGAVVKGSEQVQGFCVFVRLNRAHMMLFLYFTLFLFLHVPGTIVLQILLAVV